MSTVWAVEVVAGRWIVDGGLGWNWSGGLESIVRMVTVTDGWLGWVQIDSNTVWTLCENAFLRYSEWFDSVIVGELTLELSFQHGAILDDEQSPRRISRRKHLQRRIPNLFHDG